MWRCSEATNNRAVPKPCPSPVQAPLCHPSSGQGGQTGTAKLGIFRLWQPGSSQQGPGFSSPPHAAQNPLVLAAVGDLRGGGGPHGVCSRASGLLRPLPASPTPLPRHPPSLGRPASTDWGLRLGVGRLCGPMVRAGRWLHALSEGQVTPQGLETAQGSLGQRERQKRERQKIPKHKN